MYVGKTTEVGHQCGKILIHILAIFIIWLRLRVKTLNFAFRGFGNPYF